MNAPPTSREGPPAAGLRPAYEAGQRSYGPLALDFDHFACEGERRLRRRLERGGEAPAQAAGADLFLAIACEAKVPGAWEAFHTHFQDRMIAALLHQGCRRGEAEELVRDAIGDLLLPPASGAAPTRFATYDGTGTLASWLCTIVLRRLADRARAARGTVTETPPDGPAREDPAELALEAEELRRAQAALATAWRTLSAQEALGLVGHFRDGLSQAEIGILLRVRQPRVSKILKQAARRLRAGLEPALLRGADPVERERMRAALRGALGRLWSFAAVFLWASR